MNFAYIFSLILIILAVVSVFIPIEIVSNYAFWVSVVAYIILASAKSG